MPSATWDPFGMVHGNALWTDLARFCDALVSWERYLEGGNWCRNTLDKQNKGVEEINFTEYIVFYEDRKNRVGGLLLLVRNNIKAVERNDLENEDSEKVSVLITGRW